MAFKSVKKIEPHWYTPEDQKDDDNPMRVKVRPLTSTEQADILSQLQRIGKAGPALFRDCFRIGAIQIENAEKPNGKMCKSPQAFLMLADAFEYVVEVGAYIFDISFDDEDEKKT